MTDKIGELILEQLFILQNKCATKDDLKNFATKDDLKAMEERMDAKYATKEDLKAMEERLDAKMDKKFAEQSQEIAEQFHMAFESAERIHKQMEARINKRIDQKIAQALQF